MTCCNRSACGGSRNGTKRLISRMAAGMRMETSRRSVWGGGSFFRYAGRDAALAMSGMCKWDGNAWAQAPDGEKACGKAKEI